MGTNLRNPDILFNKANRKNDKFKGIWLIKTSITTRTCVLNMIYSPIYLFICRNREILELGLDNEDSEHENDEDTNQSKSYN